VDHDAVDFGVIEEVAAGDLDPTDPLRRAQHASLEKVGLTRVGGHSSQHLAERLAVLGMEAFDQVDGLLLGAVDLRGKAEHGHGLGARVDHVPVRVQEQQGIVSMLHRHAEKLGPSPTMPAHRLHDASPGRTRASNRGDGGNGCPPRCLKGPFPGADGVFERTRSLRTMPYGIDSDEQPSASLEQALALALRNPEDGSAWDRAESLAEGRADTAAVAALAVIQSIIGDWR